MNFYIYMKRFLFFASLVLLISPIVSSAQTIDFKVRGVGLGTSYKEVLRRLGKPMSNKKGGTNSCGGEMQVLRYSGLTITLDENEDKQNAVIFIEVASPKWKINSGGSVGASLKSVLAKFGQPDTTKIKSGLNALVYLDGDGSVTFYFRNKKLVKAVREENLC